jgi:hypothetical protein
VRSGEVNGTYLQAHDRSIGAILIEMMGNKAKPAAITPRTRMGALSASARTERTAKALTPNSTELTMNETSRAMRVLDFISHSPVQLFEF